MAQERQINPMVKMALEYGPIILFFVAYLRLKDRVFTIGGTEYDGFIVVTAAFIPILVAATGAIWALTGKINRMQIATVVLVVVFGGLSVWLNDDRFFKMKPTIIYVLFGGVLAVGLLRGQSYLKYVMEEMMPLQDAGWMLLTKRLMLFFFGMAIANELIWRMFSTEIWVYFKTFGLTAAIFAFFMTQGSLFQTYGIEKDDSGA
ncbi:septation protein IspZ [Sulfitobacter mediterraneus]|uniref:inner membrane-spanning protein YciB n=1 Tax=Sulfitobacter mediterraneus TaxID=83219 RepID=UPI00193A54B7|nr:inner membrane-spanning protein YciB [Sulfitobacter mediterraneus]MBM1557434.1 septation protein IspZ [Sulfitobacter mediterraneus]MBM1568480.1 septation protein IspZ [Sulfitobacter mediterraneus]MBM1571917.1 septation protein IspZ [Sulfitobacter mediterraneus]MBM1575706.1 septation protein IspZ [Sulfitobacter mediterraneus]MBM1580028.1 septation protein IspZ [Sulfitobacter mediterraneus]